MGKGQAPVPITGYRWARFALPILRLKLNSIGLTPTGRLQISPEGTEIFVGASLVGALLSSGQWQAFKFPRRSVTDRSRMRDPMCWENKRIERLLAQTVFFTQLVSLAPPKGTLTPVSSCYKRKMSYWESLAPQGFLNNFPNFVLIQNCKYKI